MKKNSKAKSIYLGADHDGFYLKEYLKEYLNNQGYEVRDLGNTKFQPKDDYPDYAKKVAQKIAKEKNALGILLCDSGQGMCMVANRFKDVRAALGWSVAATKRAKHDDNNNILCLPAWPLTQEKARRITNAFLNTPFSNLPRHKRRIKKIKA